MFIILDIELAATRVFQAGGLLHEHNQSEEEESAQTQNKKVAQKLTQNPTRGARGRPSTKIQTPKGQHEVPANHPAASEPSRRP